MSLTLKKRVEVCLYRDGYTAVTLFRPAVASYSPGSGDRCVVRYFDCDVTDSVPFESVRPEPPIPSCRGYHVAQLVDAFEGGAWWVGRVSRVSQQPEAQEVFVRLNINGDEIDFPFFRIRPHLIWHHGEWVPPPPSRAPIPRTPSSLRIKIAMTTSMT